MTDLELQALIDEVDEWEACDWEETTRDERHWMRQSRELAVLVQKMRKL